MTKTAHIPETFVGIGYTRHRAGLPLEGVRVPVPKPADDEVLIRVAGSADDVGGPPRRVRQLVTHCPAR
jgi:hypothetical protein